MDDVKPPKPRNFDDVTRPGSIPAAPSSNPVIVGNQTVQADPMMATTQPQPSQPSISVQPPMSTREAPIVPAAEAVASTMSAADGGPSQFVATSLGEVSLAEETEQPQSIESIHKISHENAFFGQMKPPKSKFKKFLIFLLVLLVMAGVSYGAWYVLNTKKETPTPEPVVTAPVVEKSTNVAPTVPDGYTTYKSEDFGYSFNYPKEYGKFTKSPLAQSSTEQQSNFRLESELPKTEYGPGISGAFVIESDSSNSQVVKIDKFSPTIKLVNGKWIVVTANEADVSKNKVDDEYKDYTQKIVVGQKNGDLTVYTFTSLYEGNYTTLLVFSSKSVLHNIFLPAFSNGGSQGNAPLNDKTTYDTLVKNVRDSVYLKTN